MHKTFKEFFEKNGLSISGNGAHGVLNGYETNFAITNNVVFHIAFYATEDQRNAIANAVKVIVDKNTQYAFDKFGVAISVTNMFTMGKTAEKAIKLTDSLGNILKENGAMGVGYCPVCGRYTTEENSSVRNVEGMLITIDNDCVNQINEAILQENLEFENAPNNYLKGFLGALIGAAAGAIVAIILYFIGFYAGISSFVSVFVGLLLYKKFGGKPNKMMLVIVTVTTFVTMIAAIMILYLLAAVGFTEGRYGMFEAFSVCMSEVEGFASSFIADMVMTLLFTVVGCISEIVKAAKSIKRTKNI